MGMAKWCRFVGHADYMGFESNCEPLFNTLQVSSLHSGYLTHLEIVFDSGEICL